MPKPKPIAGRPLSECTLDDLVRALRLVVREELERAEAFRRGERPPGQRRVRSPALAVELAPRPTAELDALTEKRVLAAIERARRRGRL